mgnify:CR=1 FL=1
MRQAGFQFRSDTWPTAAGAGLSAAKRITHFAHVPIPCPLTRQRPPSLPEQAAIALAVIVVSPMEVLIQVRGVAECARQLRRLHSKIEGVCSSNRELV